MFAYCLGLISFFGMKVFFRLRFQEYKEVPVLNLVSFMALLYPSDYCPLPLFRFEVGQFMKSLIKETTE